MDAYYKLVMEEYNTQLGYDIHEIDRCVDTLREYLYDSVGYDDDYMGGLVEEEIESIVEDCKTMLHETLSGVHCREPDETHPVSEALAKIESYRGGDQQRTDEWYARRRGMITASIAKAVMNIDYSTGKGIGVLREKIIQASRPDESDRAERSFVPPSNPDAPTVRGIRYEPVIRQVYEHIHNVTVEEYDCVPHAQYPFIGASPDGIVTKGSTRGRMVEIKCPQPASIHKDGNRVRPEYWSQMQLQMEVCNLVECDYVRVVVREAPTIREIQQLIRTTKKEYTSMALYPEMGKKDSAVIAAGTVWMDQNGEYHCSNPIERKFRHEDSVIQNHKGEVLFVRHFVIFAKDWFTVTVGRNRDWFTSAFLPKAKLAWEEIQRGLDDPEEWARTHPVKKRAPKEPVMLQVIKDPSVCLMADDSD